MSTLRPPSLFEDQNRRAILGRLGQLEATSARVWGKMDPAQMLSHCAIALEAGTGDVPRRQKLVGKIFAPFVKRGLLEGEKPFPKNSPTDPAFVVSDPRDFAAERERLRTVIDRFCALGPDSASRQVHSFFGKLTGDEWGRAMYKHLDHHLRQFGV